MTLIRTSPSGPNIEVDAPVDLGPNTIYGNPTAAPAVGVDIPLGLNTVLGRVAGNIVAAQLVTAQIALNQVTNAVLAQGAALTVKANPTGAIADFQDVPATANDTVFRRVGDVLDFGPLTPGMLPPAIIPLSSIEQLAANTVVANATAGLASPTAVPVGTNTVLGRVAGNIVAAQIVTSQIGASQVTNAELAPMDARTVKVNATAAPANPQDLVVGMNSVVGRVGGNIIAAQIVTAQIALNQVDNTILAQMAANTVKVNATALLADPQDLAVGLNTVLGRVGGNIIAAQLVTAQIALNQVTNAVLAQMTALTVKANATNALANAQDLAAGSNDTLLRRTGDTLNFGALTPGMIPSAIIPLSSIEQLAANTVVANATAGLASPTAVPVGLGTVLGRVAGNIVAAQLVDAQIANATISLPKLATQAANTVLANATAGVASPTAVAVGTNTVIGRVAGNIVAAQVVNAQVVGGALGTVKGVALGGVAGTLADLTGVEVGELVRVSGFSGQALAAGVYNDFSTGLTNAIKLLDIDPTGGDVEFTGFSFAGGNTGVWLVLGKFGASDRVILRHNNSGSLAANRIFCPGGVDYILSNNLDTVLIWYFNGRFQVVERLTPAEGLSPIAANTVLANATAGVASPTAVAVGTNTVLGRVAGNIVAAQLVDAQITNATISLPKLATQAANTVLANATAAVASPTAIAVGTNTVLGRVAGNIVAAQVVNAQMVGGALSTVKGVAVNGVAGTLQDLTADQLGEITSYGTNQTVASATGTLDIVLATSTTTVIINSIGNCVLRSMTGRAEGSEVRVQFTGGGNSLTISNNDGTAVLQRIFAPGFTNVVGGDQTVLTFHQRSSVWTTFATNSFGRFNSVHDGLVSASGGGTTNFLRADNTFTTVAVSSITAIAANTVLANATAGVASPTAFAVGTNTVLGRVAGNIVAAQVVNAQVVGGGLGTLKGVALSGVAGTLQDVTAAQIVDIIEPEAATWTALQTFNGGVVFGGLQTESVAGTVDITLAAGTTRLLLSSTADFVLNSIAPPSATGGLPVFVEHVRASGTGNGYVVHASGTAPANAGIFCPDSIDLPLGQRAGFFIVYRVDGWRVIGNTPLRFPIALELEESGNGPFNDYPLLAATHLLCSGSAGVFTGITGGGTPGRVLIVSHQGAGFTELVHNSASSAVNSRLFNGRQGKNLRIFDNEAAYYEALDTASGATTQFRWVLISPVFPYAQSDDDATGDIVAFTGTNYVRITGGNNPDVVLRGNATFGTVSTAALAAQAANTVLANATAGVASPTAFAVGTNTVLGRVAGNIVAAQVVNAQITGGTLGTVKGVALGGVAGTLQDLTGLELGELARFATIHSEGAGGTFNDYALPATANRLLVSATSVFTGIANGAEGRWLVIENSAAFGSGVTVSIQQFSGLSAAANRFLEPTYLGTNDNSLIMMPGASSLWCYTASRWKAVFPFSLSTSIAANSLFANATAAAGLALPLAVGTNTVLGRVAGNIVAAQAVNAQITGGGLGTVKGVALTGVAGTLADLTGAQVGALARWTGLEIQSLAAGTHTVTVAATTNWLYINTTGNVVIDAIVRTGGNSGSLLHVFKNNTDSGTLTLRYNLASGANLIHTPNDTDVVMYGVWAGASVFHNGFEWFIPDAQTLPANSVLANVTTAPGAAAGLSIGTNTVLGRVAGNVVAAQAVNAQITGGTLGTVKGVALGGVAGTLQDLTQTQQAEQLRFSTVVSDTTSSGTVATYTVAATTTAILVNTPTAVEVLGISIPAVAGQRILFRRELSSPAAWTFRNANGGTPILQQQLTLDLAQDVELGVNQCLELEYNNNRWRQIGSIASTFQAANTILANATAASAAPVALSVGTNTVLGRVAGNIVAAQLVDAQIANATISLPKLATAAANTVIANATAGAASPTAVAVGTNTVLGRVAGNIVAAQLVTAQIAVNQVTNAVLAQMAANTVKANATAALADPQDVAVGTNTVLGRVAGNIVAAQLVDAQITNATISLPKLATAAANTVIANATAGAASPTAVTVGTNTVLGRVAGNIVAAQIVTAQIAVNQVTNAVLAQMAANTVKVNATAALADAQDVSIGTNTVLGRLDGNIVAGQVAVNQLSNGGVTGVAPAFHIGPFTIAATGAAADDVTIFSSNAPRAFQIVRMIPVITVGQPAGTLQARSLAGGLGSALSSTFGATVASDAPVITANLGVFGSVAAGSSLFIRRSNGNIQFVVVFQCIPL